MFEPDETKKLKLISAYYEVTKRLLIQGEQVDPENRTLPQVINELRNCLDHIVRVVQFKTGTRSVENDDSTEDYVKANLEKAYSHVYRAAYDALDWIALTVKERIIAEMRDFSVETIKEVLPSYYPEMRPRFEEILIKDIVELRMKKDVASRNEDNLVQYGILVSELEKIFVKITSRKSGLIEVEIKRKKQYWFGMAWKLLLAFLGGGGVTLLLKFLGIIP